MKSVCVYLLVPERQAIKDERCLAQQQRIATRQREACEEEARREHDERRFAQLSCEAEEQARRQ